MSKPDWKDVKEACDEPMEHNISGLRYHMRNMTSFSLQLLYPEAEPLYPKDEETGFDDNYERLPFRLLELFVKAPLECDFDVEDTFSGLEEILDKLNITEGHTLVGLNKLVELAGLAPLSADFDIQMETPEAFEAMQPVLEGIYKSEQFWQIVGQRGLDRPSIISNFLQCSTHGRRLMQVHYLREVRARLEKIIAIGCVQEDELLEKLKMD